MTALEVLVNNGVLEKPEISNMNLILYRDSHITTQKDIRRAMIEFAKLKVKEALEAAADNAEITWDGLPGIGEFQIVDKESILNAYNLDNIK